MTTELYKSYIVKIRVLITLIPDVCVFGCDTVVVGMHVDVIVVVVNTARDLYFGATFKRLTTKFWQKKPLEQE